MPFGNDNVVKVWDHCACDGVTPDADALQHCFDLAKQFERNVQFPARRPIYLEKPVIATASNSIMEGANCTIINGTLDKPALTIGDSVNDTWSNTLRDLVFTQRILQPGEVLQPGNMGLYVVKQSHFCGEGLMASPYPASLREGIKLIDVINSSSLSRTWVTGTLQDGVSLNTCNDLSVRDVYGMACGRVGVAIKDCHGIYGGGLGGYGNDLHAIELGTGGLEPNGDFQITHWGGDTSGDANIKITHLRRAWIGITWAATQKSRGVNMGAPGVELRGETVQRVHFEQGCTYNNNGPGTAVMNSPGGQPLLCSWGANFDHGSAEFPNGVGNNQAGTGNRVGLYFDGATNKHIVRGYAVGNPDGAIKSFNPNVVNLLTP